MKRKVTLIIMACLIASLTLAGCARNRNTPSPTPPLSPSISPVLPSQSPVIPAESASPGVTEANQNNKPAADAIKAEVDKLSEIDSAQVIVLGNVALVGVKFTSQYQGGITERIVDMVNEKAKAAHSDIMDVVVTDSAEHVTQIEGLIARNGEDISNEVSDLIDQINKVV